MRSSYKYFLNFVCSRYHMITEAYLETSRTSTMGRFAKTVNGQIKSPNFETFEFSLRNVFVGQK